MHEIKKGQIFKYWTVIKEAERKNNKRRALVKCVCGKTKIVDYANLLSGVSGSCGCKKCFKHGYSRTRIYSEWSSMRQRCSNKKHSSYKYYGGMGVSVCELWQNDFIAFKDWALNNGYSDELTIDRIDGNKNYFPDNCRWVNYLIQNTNTRTLSTNTSGYTGISWSKKENKWLAIISINNRTKRIGAYFIKKDAVIARNDFIDKNNLPHKKNTWIEN